MSRPESSPRVKICGLTSEEDVDAAVDAGATALGFLVDVTVDTERELAPTRAAELCSYAPPLVSTVLVTMPDTPSQARELGQAVGADTLQVHGSLSADALEALTAEFSVIASVEVTDRERIRQLDDGVDALLLDSTDETGAGGTGRTHDWETAADIVRETETPVILAGGLTPENVEEAIRTVAPYGVDVASGVESAEGNKDHDAVAAFLESARTPRSEAPR